TLPDRRRGARCAVRRRRLRRAVAHTRIRDHARRASLAGDRGRRGELFALVLGPETLFRAAAVRLHLRLAARRRVRGLAGVRRCDHPGVRRRDRSGRRGPDAGHPASTRWRSELNDGLKRAIYTPTPGSAPPVRQSFLVAVAWARDISAAERAGPRSAGEWGRRPATAPCAPRAPGTANRRRRFHIPWRFVRRAPICS